MGRGQYVQTVLPLTPLVDVPTLAASALTPPLVEGALELSWNADCATLQLHAPSHALLDTSSIPRLDLRGWLHGMEDLFVASTITPFFGHFKFSKVDYTLPCVYGAQGDATLLLSRLTSWADLRAFLLAAHNKRLF